MPTTPAVKASTQTKVVSPENNPLMRAMAAAISAGAEGRSNLDKISTKLQKREKEQHAKDMKRGKK